MRKFLRDKSSHIIFICVLLIQIIFMIFYCDMKKGYFVDELWSYGLSNSYYHAQIWEDGALDNPEISPDMFKARLRNLIDNRRRLKAFFGDKTSLKASNVSELDKGFAARLRDMIEKNMSSENFSVEDMAAQMGVGRTQLYRKVKSLMGFSPVELLRIARLKKAAELLRRTEMTVAEVAYEVGFASPSYMAKCFKEYFGVNPTEYK